MIFFLIPFVFIAKISFSEAVIQQPPYLPLTIFNEEGVLQISLNFSNYQYLLEDTLYFLSYLTSLKIAFFSTIFCLLIGYPLAYYIARSSEVKRNFLLLLIVLPFWTSFLLRVYAWIGLLKPSIKKFRNPSFLCWFIYCPRSRNSEFDWGLYFNFARNRYHLIQQVSTFCKNFLPLS